MTFSMFWSSQNNKVDTVEVCIATIVTLYKYNLSLTTEEWLLVSGHRAVI